MTQEEKAKAYDEALKWMRELYPGLHGATKEDAEHYFPELAESKDERIRKVLLNLVSNDKVNGYTEFYEEGGGITCDDAIAWLEKQDVFSHGEGYYYRHGDGTLIYMGGSALEATLEEQKVINEYNNWLSNSEKQKEQKPMYNLEIPAGDVAPAEEDGPFDEDEFLENELSAFLQNYDKEYDDDAAISDVARHFYEIGKKQKEQKPNIELIQRSWYMEGYHDRAFGQEPKWIIKTGAGGPKYEENPKYGQMLEAEQKPAEWSEEDEKRILQIERIAQQAGCTQKLQEEIHDWLKSLRPQQKRDGGDDYNKGYTEGYNKGYKDANKSVSDNFPVMPTTPSGFGCDGTHCTNPHMDCINCPRKIMDGMLNNASSSGDPTLKAEWKPSEDEERLINTSISFLKDFADKGYENAVECIDWLKSKLNGNTGK